MGFGETNFKKLGEAMDQNGVPPAALEYMHKRGHRIKGMKAAGFRYIDDENLIAQLFPASKVGTDGVDKKHPECWWPLWAIVLPYSNDPSFAVARIEYEIKNLGKTDGPSKFLTPTGREVLPYVPPMVSRKDLLNPKKRLYIVESQFKSVVAAINGVSCVGVSGHAGVFEPDTGRTKIRTQLHEYMQRGREVVLLTDADVIGNLDVRKSLLQFMDIAETEFGCVPMYVELPDLGDGKSGIDDYFASGAKLKDFDKLPRHARSSKVVTELRCAFLNFTQMGLAKRFIARYDRDCRHDARLKSWFTYTADRGYVSGDVEPFRHMKTVVEGLSDEHAAEHNPGAQKKREAFQENCERETWMDAALSMAAKDKALEINAALFDADQDLIGCKNGVLRLSDGKLLAPSRDLMVTKSMACAYDPKAKAPRWEGFISRICAGKRDMMNYLQEIAGTCLMGRSARQEVFFLYGEGSNGKSVYIETLTRLLADYAVTIPARVLLKAHRSGDPEKATPFLITLHGKRLATCSELNENVPLDEATLKDLNGGDLISGRENYGKSFQFRNTARMVVRCNHLPVVTGTDKAVWDRIRAVPFTVIIPEHEQDPDFATKIAAAELPGILTWMCAGRRRFVERGNRFDTPKAVLELTEKHRKDSNVFGTWLAECVDIDTKQDKAPYIELQAEVTKCHTEWSRANNHVALSSKNLWAKMREHLGYDPVTRGDHGVKRVKGMRLLRNDMADNLIAHNNKTIDVLEKRLAVADMKEKLRDLRDRKSMADAAEIAQLEDKLEKLQGELARLQGVGGGTTSPTSSGKQRLFVVRGGKK